MVNGWEKWCWYNKNSICHIKERQQFYNPKRNGELMASDKLFEILVVVIRQVVSNLWPHALYSLPGSSVHGILQAIILEWVAIYFPRGSSQPKNWIQVSCLAGRFTDWATREGALKHFQFSSVVQLCPTLCDPMNRSTPGLPVHHQLPEFPQTHDHWVSDAIQPSHPVSSPSPTAPNLSQHQSLF